METTPQGKWQVYVGTFIHSLSRDTPVKVVNNGIIGVKGGKIQFVSDNSGDQNSLRTRWQFSDEDVVLLNKNEFLIPGFVDTHIHAPQYPNSGLGLDLPLLQWLQKYTYPLERRYTDKDFAKKVYEAVVTKTLKNGTTSASYFATVDVDSTLLLCDICEEFGQRALVGKVSMNRLAPDYYVESTQNAMSNATLFIEKVLSKKYQYVRPTITPRFTVCCDKELMRHLAELSRKHGLHVQSHISENRDEIELVQQLEPESAHYADTYDSAGLLHQKTILAHGVFLTDKELKVLKQNDVSISHCPNSNIALRSGLCDVKRLWNSGLRVGLGTDVSGGYHPSMLDAIRHAIVVSKVSNLEDDHSNVLSSGEGFYLATLGGAEALCMDGTCGNFQVGKCFDAQLINITSQDSPIDVLQDETIYELFEKFLNLGDDRNVSKVFVEGVQRWPPKFIRQ